MTYTEKELNQFLHGISLSLLSKKSAQHWRYDEETAKEIEWLEVLERKVRADKADRKTENSSEKPNNCEHITEDGVTCAKYPACDDCPDNPLNKVKGSERLVKGSGQTDCQTCKWLSSYGYCVHRECKGYEPQTENGKEQVMICTQVTQISHSTVGSSFSVSFSADSTPNDLEMLRMMREWFMRWNNSGVSFTKADTPQTEPSEEEIREAIIDGCKRLRWNNSGVSFTKADTPQTDCGWK